MYFCRCYNRDYQYRKNSPSACKPEETIPRQEPTEFFKTASAGGINLPGTAGAQKEYDLVALHVDFISKKSTTIVLDFACNITFINAKADINIQLVKLGAGQPVPVASPAVYRRTLDFSGSDTIFFSVHDTLPAQNTSCSYLVKMSVTGNTPENSMIIVTDPVITAMVL